jgi:hypothetical protein
LSPQKSRLIGVVVIASIVVVGVIVMTRQSAPVIEAGGHDYCFAEWCIAPIRVSIETQPVTVTVTVRSDAKQASQKPDHPQVWVIDAAGRQVGGPQHSLDRLIGPGDSYTSTLTFYTQDQGPCPRLLVSEGGWPAFLGLGYSASPFTSSAEWRLCEIAG